MTWLRKRRVVVHTTKPFIVHFARMDDARVIYDLFPKEKWADNFLGCSEPPAVDLGTHAVICPIIIL